MNTAFRIIQLFLFMALSVFSIDLTAQSTELPYVEFLKGARALDLEIASEGQQEISGQGCFDGTCYRWIQFGAALSQEQQDAARAAGLELMEYVRQHCYLVSMTEGVSVDQLYALGARAMEIPDVRTKVEERLELGDIPDHARKGEDVLVKVRLMPGVRQKVVLEELGSGLVSDVSLPSHDSYLFFSASRSTLLSLASKAWIRTIDLIDPPGKPESVEGRSLQKANVLDNHLSGSGALSFDGDGVGILVRDDGDVGPHIDYQGRLWNDPNNSAQGTHGDGVAGVWSAAGNLDPTVVAAAPAADVYVIDYLSNFLDNTLSLHTDSGVVITNSSYSNGCNTGYTSTTVTVDEMAHDYPTLLHMFSAGNSNNNDCGYGAGDQWGNITGGHKQGKNVIAVANLFRDGTLVNSSSRGPAHDGRIKPDLAAHGQGQMSTDPNNQYSPFGGTSAAAPSAAGNLTQLYHAHRTLYGTTPDAALIKAIAMNTAEDLGNPGPDFRFGWGLVHGANAYEVLENQQYELGTLTTNQTVVHNISVPQGVGELRVMVYWNDPEASTNAQVALVNDLDLQVIPPSGTPVLPRVLDPTPNASTLNLPATSANAPDRLNNVEQVAVTAPGSGTYVVQVTGHAVPQGPQEYIVVYAFISDEVRVTYPLGGERLIPGVTERIHWDALTKTGSFEVEFSSDDGASWSTIQSGIPGETRSIDWTVPQVTTSEGRIRVTHNGGYSSISEESFHVFGVPSNIAVTLTSLDSAELTWNSVAGATQYFIYRLGIERMELIDSTFNLQYSVGGLVDGETYWFSVSANANDVRGQRAVATPIENDAFSFCSGCFLRLTTPVEAHFSEELDRHCNMTDDDIDWIQNSGSTPSSGTGPQTGFTGENYVYVEATGSNNPMMRTHLAGPCMSFNGVTNAYMQFNYHMFGSQMGFLRLEVSTNNGSSWVDAWSVSGDQGSDWQDATVDLSAYTGGNFNYRFVGETGQGFRSDIALDNIRLDLGSICERPLNLSLASGAPNTINVQLPTGVSAYDLLVVDRTEGEEFDDGQLQSGVTNTTFMLNNLIAGHTYHVYVRSACSSNKSAWHERLVFDAGCSGVLAGNTFANPIVVPQLPFVDMQNSSVCFTNDFNGESSADVFYAFTTSSTADTVRMTTCSQNTQLDSYIHLLSESGTVLAFNDDMNDNCGFSIRHSEIVYAVQPSTTYILVVEGWSGLEGPFEVTIEEVGDCVNQINLTGPIGSGTYAGQNVNASGTIPSPNQVIFSASNDVNLLPNFEVQQGGTLETNNDGCP